jgi:serine phosphatase RsbU (regulator of sigma subunit)
MEHAIDNRIPFPMRADTGRMSAPLATRAASIDVHAVSRPAWTFTGDFYFTHRNGERLWLALGDVAGKGLPAAIVMAMIQEELESRFAACARTRCDPATTAQRIHDLLRPVLPPNRFATMVVSYLSDDGTLVLVNAGHCPPLIVRAGGGIERLGSTGPVVGILPSPRWESATIRLEPGDAMLLYSDGLAEASAPDGTEFGTSGIESSFGAATGDARSRVEAVVRAVDRFAGGKLADDLTVAAFIF